MKRTKWMVVVSLLMLAVLVLTACKPVTETTEPAAQVETVEVMVEKPSFSTPNPILSDLKVRQAIHYCTNKMDIAKAVFPLLTDAERAELVMESIIPPPLTGRTPGMKTSPSIPMIPKRESSCSMKPAGKCPRAIGCATTKLESRSRSSSL